MVSKSQVTGRQVIFDKRQGRQQTFVRRIFFIVFTHKYGDQIETALTNWQKGRFPYG